MLGRMFDLLKGDELAARARRGTLLTLLSIAGGNIMRLASNLVLTRLLFPEAFGLMALVYVFLSATKMFTDIGLRTSIVQHPRGDDPSFLATAWTLQVVRGFLLWGATIAAAPYVATFYEEPQLAEILPYAGFSMVITGFMPSRVMVANRHLQLGRQTILGLSNQAVTILITIIFAIWLESVWALVWATLIGSVLKNIGLRIYMPGEKDRFAWDWAAVRDLVGFGKFVFLSTLATFILTNGDRAVLGKFITLEMLGVYSIAMSLAGMPPMLLQRLSSRVIFPIYSRRPPDKHPDARRKIFKARFLLTGLAFLGCVTLALLGDQIVRLLYDERYYSAGAITMVAALGFLPVIIVATYEAVLLANGRSDRYALITATNGVLRLGALYYGVTYFGVLGAVAAPAIATLLYYPVLVAVTRRYKAWDPIHDAVFGFLSILVVAAVWYFYSGSVLVI